MPRYHVENFGCRATQADGAAIERQLEDRGLTRASATVADLLVINSCTVTAAADQDARAAVRRFQRQNPKAKIVVTGCYAQRAPEEVAALPGVSCVIGNSHKHQLAELALHSFEAAPPTAKGLAEFSGVDMPESSPLRAAESWRLGVPESSRFGVPQPSRLGVAQGFSAAKSVAEMEGALAPEGVAFVPLTTLTAEARKPKPEARLYVSDIFAHTELLAAPVFDAPGDSNENQRTRPNLKVQDGCDNRCSFCVIPYVRGQSRSLKMQQVLAEVNALVASGYREVVISGINLGRWGRDLGFQPPASGVRRSERDLAVNHEPSASSEFRTPDAGRRTPHFEDLLRAILTETSLEKLRISSVEPMDWTDELIALVATSPRIAKHAHVPLQSGSDAVLRRMHRKYRPWHYREKIEKIRAAMPTAAIGADVMVGFPGETEAEFDSTHRLIADLPFTYLHVFTYSPRPGTLAANMPNQVPVHVARERNKILRDLAAEKKRAFMRSFIGKNVEAITLNIMQSTPDGQFTEALTDNYQKLRLKGHHAPNRWLTALTEGVADDALVGATCS